MAPPSGAFLGIERHLDHSSWQENFGLTAATLLSKDHSYTLFRQEDLGAWITFSIAFVVLLIFDNAVLNRNPRAMTMFRAFFYTIFWLFCAAGFAAYVYWWKGRNASLMWASGYMLEWMLSFDNLFVFHMIFNVYETPDDLKHRPLYFGICGAIVFRLIFIFVGEYLMHAMFFMHLVFGSFLVYTGIKTATADDEDEDPSQQPLVQFLQRRVPFVSAYDKSGAFFVKVAVDEQGNVMLPSPQSSVAAPEGGRKEKALKYGTFDVAAATAKATKKVNGRSKAVKTQWRATMLFLVVCCLEISDLLFAVDSVSAIVAQVNDLFLAYTSAVFAMLGLRATFFIIDVLAKLFSLLKYGVAVVLVFIGVKLIVSRVYHVPASIVCVVLLGSIFLSMVASVIKQKCWPSDDDCDSDEDDRIPSTPASSNCSYRTPLTTPITRPIQVSRLR